LILYSPVGLLPGYRIGQSPARKNNEYDCDGTSFDRKVISSPTGMSHTVAQAAVVHSKWIVPVCGAQVFHIRKRAHCRARQRNTLHVSHIIIVVVGIIIIIIIIIL